MPIPQVSEDDVAQFNDQIRQSEERYYSNLLFPPPYLPVATSSTIADPQAIFLGSHPGYSQPSVPPAPEYHRKTVPIPEFVPGRQLFFTSRNEPGVCLAEFEQDRTVLDCLDQPIVTFDSSVKTIRWRFIWPGYREKIEVDVPFDAITTYRDLALMICELLHSYFVESNKKKPSEPGDQQWRVNKDGPMTFKHIWLMSFGCIDLQKNEWAAEFELLIPRARTLEDGLC
ncbi:unnamed protein product [Somion occarium]